MGSKRKKEKSSKKDSPERIRKHRKKHKKKNKKQDSILPSIDALIAQKLQDKKRSSNSNSTQVETCQQEQSFKPMTKAEYDDRQSVIRKVYDEDTGRMRLGIKKNFLKVCCLKHIETFSYNFSVKGDGEIIEEIVSASRQKEINKSATKGDGDSFQASLRAALSKNQN